MPGRKAIPPTRRPLVILLTAALAAILSAGAGAPSPGKGNKPTAPENYDIRIHGKGNLEKLLREVSSRSAAAIAGAARLRRRSMESALERLRGLAPGADASYSPLTGSAEVVRGLKGLWTQPPGRTPSEAVMEYFRAQAAAYGLSDAQARGLELLGESTSRAGGLTMVRVRQRIGSLPVFQSETRVLLDREGRLIRTVGRIVPGLEDSAPPLSGLIPPSAALRAALKSLGIETEGVPILPAGAGESGGSAGFTAPAAGIFRPVRSELVLFPLAPGVAVPAWSLVLFMEGPADWYLLVDARQGTLLYLKNIRSSLSTEEARFGVYSQAAGVPADSPAPSSPSPALPGAGTQFPEISRSVEEMLETQDATASPAGWIPDGGTTTTGNNVDAYLDRDGNDAPDAGALDSNGRPVGNPDAEGRNRDFLGSAPRSFAYAPPPQGGTPRWETTPPLPDFSAAW